MTRLYCNVSLIKGADISLTLAQSHYVTTVLRMQQGMDLVCFNGDGCNYPAKITAIDKKFRVIVTIYDQNSGFAPSPVALHLYPGMIKPKNMDIIIQKAVELGVSTITPLLTQFAFSALNKKDHWQGIIHSAAEQCGRSELPLLNPSLSFQELTMKGVLHSHGQDVVASFDPHGEPWTTVVHAHACHILLGPEGGWSPVEYAWLKQNTRIVSVGERILRAETAAIVALTLAHAFCKPW
jgi:16S rRNA (uracil1498-N3)-methyltransferase